MGVLNMNLDDRSCFGSNRLETKGPFCGCSNGVGKSHFETSFETKCRKQRDTIVEGVLDK